jgi:hypothetical protein
MTAIRTLLGTLTFALLAQAAAADPFVESISPPVLEVGKVTRITLAGRELANAEGLWFSVLGLSAKPIESGAERAVFDVTTAKTAPVGVAGLRIATRNGLGNACLFLIDDLPVRPRGDGENPVKLALPVSTWGTLREATLDRYSIEVAAGATLSFEAVANRFGKDSDPLITIRDPAGKVVAERDNDSGLYFDCRFAHTFEKAGSHTVEIRDARYQGNEHHKYVLRIGKFPAVRVATKPAKSGVPGLSFGVLKDEEGSAWVPEWTSSLPTTVAPSPWSIDSRRVGNSSSHSIRRPFSMLEPLLVNCGLQAMPASVPGELLGVIAQPGWRPAFALKLTKGQKIHVRGEAKSLNSPADAEVVVLDRTGREQRRTGDSDLELPFDYTAPNDGEYRLVLRDRQHDGGPDFTVRLTVRSDPFPPKLVADVEGLTVPQGSYQPVPILVTRFGTIGPIKLTLRGAAAGLKLTPSEIGEKETAVVCKLEADGAAALGLHTVQIVAESGTESVIVTTQPLIDKKKQNVDLIPIALRDDQRRLPPSVADRFAVFVTPPAPFTFELPQTLVTLPRYQKSPIATATTRTAGFDGPIHFEARGGQLADKNEGRTRVYAEFPDATAKQPNVGGVAVSKILSNTAKARIDVSATGTHSGRQVTLIRTFELDLVSAFKITPDAPKLMLAPGETGTVRLTIDRVPSFDGPVLLHLNPQDGLQFEETVRVAKEQKIVEIKVVASAAAGDRRGNLQIEARATVDGYEEEVRVPNVEIEVKTPKK